MRFYAVFKVESEEHVLLDADNWQDAARLAASMERPVISKKSRLEVVGMVEDDSIDEEDLFEYDSCHDIAGPCNKCGHQILDRGCGSDACREAHKDDDKRGGYVSTKHGHVTWCSQACRDADRENDCDLDALDRMSGIADG
ncbi:MAG: hypothetical protein AB7L09_02650 [Nitrospira sp.]